MDNYSTSYLLGVLRGLKRPKKFLLNLAFPRLQVFQTQKVSVDVEVKKRRVAPFVAPSVAGKVMQELGYDTVEFEPAYLKPKTPLEPEASLERSIGEQMGGDPNMQAIDRDMLRVSKVLLDQADSIAYRMEIMASETLRLSQVTVSGEGYQTRVVSFGRNAALTIAKAVGAKWSDAGVNPLKDIEDAAEIAHKEEGAKITDIVMDPDAWSVFKENAIVQKFFEHAGGLQVRIDGIGNLNIGPTAYADIEGADFKGKIGTFNVWVYSEWYLDDNGVTQPMLPSGTVIGVGKQDFAGIRAHGAILDKKAGLKPLEIFPKSWDVEDPACTMVMSQSAPITVPGRPNASFCMSVL